MKGAIWTAYADVDMTKPCPGCGASSNTWCTNEITGRVRRAPCPGRPRATVVTTAVEHEPVRDFTQPLHFDESDR